MIILRHAEAVDLSQTGGSDRARHLTPRGESQARLAGKALQQMGLVPRLIWSSPYPRAMQTAQIAASQWGQEKAVQPATLLEPGANAGKIIQQIVSAPPAESLMLVGHNPELEVLVEHLIAQAGPARVNLGKGSIALLEIDEPLGRGCATLKGLWSSGQLKTLCNGKPG